MRFIRHRLRLFPRGITQSLRVRAGMQRMQSVINIAASRSRGRDAAASPVF